ncbi:hypothetical protein IG631_18702 [Alternaria alternata]|nr:hypothetical protein IG631_18702 [Alternaria alternata]
MAVWKLRRETLVRIVLLGIPSGDCGVSEEFEVVSLGSAREDADYVTV